MDLDLTDEQRLLKESVDGLLARRYPDLKARQAFAAEPAGYSLTIWKELAEQGLLAIPFPEEDGGLGQGLVEMTIVAEAVGRTLAVEPFFATVVLCGGLLRHGATAAQRQALVPALCAGETTFAFAHQETQARFELADVAATARSDGNGGYVLDGAKSVVLHGDSASKLIVSARVSGARRDPDGIGLFLVDGAAPGVTRRGYPTQDGQRAADVTFAGVRVGAADILGDPAGGFPAIERTVHEAIAFLAAEAVGTMEAAHEMTVDYLKQRKQFGVPIGSFQVLQHRAVDMFTHVQQSRSMALYGAAMAMEDDAAERRKAMSAVKVQIGRSARHVGQETVQLHGGIGMTMEYKAGHYFKRLTMIDMAFGNADHHLRELAKAGGLIEAAA